MILLVKVFAIKIYCLIDFLKFFRIYTGSFILYHLFILLSLITNLYDFYR